MNDDTPAEDPIEEPTTPQLVDIDWLPLYDKLIVQRLPEKTEIRGFAVADRYRKAQNVGVVLRVGSGRWIDGVLYPLTIRPGHIVIFSHFAGAALGEDRDDIVVLREDEILAYRQED